MTAAVISVVLEQLRWILQTEVNLLAGVRKESEKLADTFTLIRGVLEDAEEKEVKNAAVKAWLEQLTRISYDADDVLDEWKTEILSSLIHDDEDGLVSEKVWSCLFSLFSCLKSDNNVHNDFGSKMIDINERLGTVKDIALLNLTERQSREEPRPVTSSFVDDSEIYGRVDDVYSIVSMLLNETSHHDSHVPLISIVGTAGFGKTTLVQVILKDRQVTNNFEKLMWVCVSKPFDLERVAKSIIQQATGDVPSTVAWQDLHERLSESVQRKKFLLVLDDVWTYDPEIWRKLKVSLKGGAYGSRIIITTRDENIARRMTSTYIHRLGQLSDEECWSFFKYIALRERQDNHKKFEEIGKKIAWKCKGVPLAVKIIASLMSLKKSVLEWEDVHTSDIWDVMSEDEHGFLPSILLSYYALPSHLKRCFSYCVVFRQDAEIDKDELIKLWMAQGFFSYDNSKDLEKIGTWYFNDLAMRSLFQEFKKDSEGNVIGCKMHDLVHDFARHLAKSESSIFMNNDREVGSIKLRHFGAAKGLDTSARLKSFICQLKCLRVLNLSETSLEELPDEVDRLLHLRLLDLSNMKMNKLPETICNLFNLQTLKLVWCSSLRKLPEGIGKLRNLRHLELAGVFNLSYFPRGLERLSCLRTLSKVILGSSGGKGCQIGELKLLNHIQGALRIEGLEQAADSKRAELKNKEKLRSLELVFSEERQDENRKRIESVLDGLQPHTNLAKLFIEGYEGNNFPSWLSSNTALPNLVNLELSCCNQCFELPGFGRLQNLQCLYLWKLGSVKGIGCEFYGLGSTVGTSTGDEDSVQSVVLFPKLHTLEILHMEECEEWHLPFRRGVEIFPKLRTLTVDNLMKMKMLPPGLGKLKTLEEVSLDSMKFRGPELFGIITKNTDNVTLSAQGEGGESATPVAVFSVLKKLTLYNMPEWGDEIRRDEEEGFVMPCLRELEISHCPKVKVLPHYLFSPALISLLIRNCPQLTGRQPCLPPLLEELELGQDTGILSNTILPLISGISSPDHNDTTNNENAYPNLHSFSISDSRQSSLPQGFNQLTAIQKLDFRFCEFLDFTPEDLKHLPMLQELKFFQCPILERHHPQITDLKSARLEECPIL